MEIKDFREKINLVNSTQLHKVLKQNGMRVSGNASEGLVERINEIIQHAIRRAKANKRITVFKEDF